MISYHKSAHSREQRCWIRFSLLRELQVPVCAYFPLFVRTIFVLIHDTIPTAAPSRYVFYFILCFVSVERPPTAARGQAEMLDEMLQKKGVAIDKRMVYIVTAVSSGEHLLGEGSPLRIREPYDHTT
eukprot:4033589-Pyramimonas_sp.AAC.2